MRRQGPGRDRNAKNELAAAEYWFGAATGVSDFVLTTTGVGIGCAVVLNDPLVSGLHGTAGMIEHWQN